MNIFKKVASKSQTVELSRSDRQIAWEMVSATGIVMQDWLEKGKPTNLIEFEGSAEQLTRIQNKLFAGSKLFPPVAGAAPETEPTETLRLTPNDLAAMRISLFVAVKMTAVCNGYEKDCDDLYYILPPKSDWPRFIEVLEAAAEKLALPEAA